MAADRNTPEGVENWLIQSSANPWSFPSIVGPELTREILQHICSRWKSYPSNIKLGVLFALLCIGKQLLNNTGNELSAIITNGCNDNDEWVRLVSKMLQNYPSTGALDLNIEQHIPQDAQFGLQKLMERIQQTGIKFHPMEYAFIDRDISDAFSTLSVNAEAVRAPTSHFILKQGSDMSRQQRLYALNNVTAPPPSPGLTSPVSATGFNFIANQNRIGSNQGLPPNRTATSTGPSLFIPKRRPSQLTQPFNRTSIPQKPGPTNTSRGPLPGSMQGPDSPTEPKITQGKKYVKPTKIQMLDITTATSITRNQEETKLKTQMEEQQMKEMRRQEREKRQEEKRREEEEKKKQKERDKAEKARQKEEAKERKEREKREKAAAKAAAAASNEMSDTQPTNVPVATRKKKKVNHDETIEEEIVSDGELSHKKPKKMVASPTSSLSPTNPSLPPDKQSSLTNNQNTVMNGSISNLTNTSVMQTAIIDPLLVTEQPIAADPELPKSQFEEIPRNDMNESLRKQFEMNCSAVLDKSNKIHGDNRQLIINFLGGHHTKPEQRERLISISNGVSSSEDEIRHIILHEEKTPIPNEGKEIQETFIFEMNLSNGQWRKLKRKKTKAVKNPNLEASNGRPNGKFHGR